MADNTSPDWAYSLVLGVLTAASLDFSTNWPVQFHIFQLRFDEPAKLTLKIIDWYLNKSKKYVKNYNSHKTFQLDPWEYQLYLFIDSVLRKLTNSEVHLEVHLGHLPFIICCMEAISSWNFRCIVETSSSLLNSKIAFVVFISSISLVSWRTCSSRRVFLFWTSDMLSCTNRSSSNTTNISNKMINII